MEVSWFWDDPPEVVKLSRLDSGHPKKSFEDYLDDRADVFPEVAYYREYGSWREKKTLSTGEREEVETAAYNQQPNECYYNAQTALTSDLEYVEGYVVGRTVFPHAWIEINGKVAEITPTVDRDYYHYYGTSFDQDDVLSQMLETEQARPLVEQFV